MVINSEDEKLEAETILPNEADVISVDTTSVKSINNLRNITIKMKIKDPEGDDYYRIGYMREEVYSIFDGYH
jgi:hypothetical protein